MPYHDTPSHIRLVALGAVPVGLFMMIVFFLRTYLGSWGKAALALGAIAALSLALLGLFWLCRGVGYFIWFGTDDPAMYGRGGLSVRLEKRAEARVAKAAAKAAAKVQDGQLSMTNAAIGQVSLTGERK